MCFSRVRCAQWDKSLSEVILYLKPVLKMICKTIWIKKSGKLGKKINPYKISNMLSNLAETLHRKLKKYSSSQKKSLTLKTQFSRRFGKSSFQLKQHTTVRLKAGKNLTRRFFSIHTFLVHMKWEFSIFCGCDNYLPKAPTKNNRPLVP